MLHAQGGPRGQAPVPEGPRRVAGDPRPGLPRLLARRRLHAGRLPVNQAFASCRPHAGRLPVSQAWAHQASIHFISGSTPLASGQSRRVPLRRSSCSFPCRQRVGLCALPSSSSSGGVASMPQDCCFLFSAICRLVRLCRHLLSVAISCKRVLGHGGREVHMHVCKQV